MKVLFDTSVLVASLIESHSEHENSIIWLENALNKKFEFYISNHTLAEIFAVLTSIPVKPKISVGMASALLKENILKHAKLISLTAKDYQDAIENISNLGFSGGVIYDALIYQAAIKAKANKILTLNVRDFERINTSSKITIVKP